MRFGSLFLAVLSACLLPENVNELDLRWKSCNGDCLYCLESDDLGEWDLDCWATEYRGVVDVCAEFDEVVDETCEGLLDATFKADADCGSDADCLCELVGVLTTSQACADLGRTRTDP